MCGSGPSSPLTGPAPTQYSVESRPCVIQSHRAKAQPTILRIRNIVYYRVQPVSSLFLACFLVLPSSMLKCPFFAPCVTKNHNYLSASTCSDPAQHVCPTLALLFSFRRSQLSTKLFSASLVPSSQASPTSEHHLRSRFICLYARHHLSALCPQRLILVGSEWVSE